MKEHIVYRFIVFLDKFGRIGKSINFKLMMFNTDRFHSLLYRKYILDKYKIALGIGSYGLDTTIFDGPAAIGKYVSIGPNVRRLCVNHPTTGVTTHPCCFNPIYKWIKNDPRDYTRLIIGNDVWIGGGSNNFTKCKKNRGWCSHCCRINCNERCPLLSYSWRQSS